VLDEVIDRPRLRRTPVQPKEREQLGYRFSLVRSGPLARAPEKGLFRRATRLVVHITTVGLCGPVHIAAVGLCGPRIIASQVFLSIFRLSLGMGASSAVDFYDVLGLLLVLHTLPFLVATACTFVTVQLREPASLFRIILHVAPWLMATVRAHAMYATE
jgi:hypothetical protein